MKIKPLLFGETQNSKKIWAYYLALIKSEEFQKKIFKIRKDCKIPVEGLTSKNVLPDNINRNLIFKSTIIICREYNLFPGDWWASIENYIEFNEIDMPSSNSGELCTVWDFVEDPEDSWDKETLKDFNNFYPLAIRISPYATQRDILDYIKKNFPYIYSSQNYYKTKSNKITKFRIRNSAIQKRNDYIFNNKMYPLKTIARLLSENLGIDMDEGAISKIISLETIRRKKV